LNQHKIWESVVGIDPIVATAIHNGHLVRKEVEELMALKETDRFQEEDPFTGEWTTVGSTRIIGIRSRFEVDLNRQRDKAVYINPEDAWEIRVWKTSPSQEIIDASLAEYDAFYSENRRIFRVLEQKFKRFVVFDLHSNCFRRNGCDDLIADLELQPVVNIVTGIINRFLWAPLVDRFINDLSSYDFQGCSLDVRKNITYKDGWFSRWIHQTFQESGCCLSIEFENFFMDGWTGIPAKKQVEDIQLALQSTVPGMYEELDRLGAKW